MKARTASANFYINGVNITSILEPHIENIRYSDTLEGESDTIEVALEDAQRKFLRGLVPIRGTAVTVELVKANWNSRIFTEVHTEAILPLGVFEVDEVTNSYPPTKCILKLNSVPNRCQIRGVDKDRAWESTTLKKIARDIANDAGLELFYDTNDEPSVARIEQSDESDLALLKRLCSDNGLSLKVHNNKLIIFDAGKYEQKNPVMELNYGDPIILHFDGSATLNGIYGDCQVSFVPNGLTDIFSELFGGLDIIKSVSGLNLNGISKLAGGAGANVLKIHKKVSSAAEAERLARAKLREKNKSEFTVNLQLKGSFGYIAGNVIKLEDFGIHSGNYIIDRSDHNLSDGGYVTAVQMHRCLEGY